MIKPPLVMGLDLGRSVGVCLNGSANPKTPITQTWTLPNRIGPMMSEFCGLLRGSIRENCIEVVCYERPFYPFGSKRANSTKHFYTAFGLASTVLRVCHEEDILCSSYTVQSTRKRICKTSKASEKEIQKACLMSGIEPATDHAADAALVWLCATRDLRDKKFEKEQT